VPFMFFVLVFGPSGLLIYICCLKHLDACESKRLLFISAIALFCLPHFPRCTLAGKSFVRTSSL
jgi:hypothetical protein